MAVHNAPSEPAAGTIASVQPPPATSAEIPPVVLQSPLVDADLPRDWTPITWHLDAVPLECVGDGSTVSFRIGDTALEAIILMNGSPPPAALQQTRQLIASIRPPAALLPITAASGVDVGVACSEANSIRCGRVGVAVGPTGDVDDVKAQISSYTTELHRTGDFLSGFITVPDLTAPPFGIRASAAGQWFGTPPAEVDVHITATTGGAPFVVTIHTSIGAGWG